MAQKKIRILYTIPNFDSAGSGKVVFDLVNNLDRKLFEPEICCFHNRGAFFKEIEKLNVKIHLFPFAINYRPFVSFPFRLIKVIHFFRKEKFDVIHSWHWSSDFSEPLAARLAGIPWMYTKKAMGWGNKAWKWRTALSTKIIIVNSDMKSFYSEKTIKKVVEIPFGVDIDFYKPQKEVNQSLLNALNIRENDFVIVSVANLTPVKGIEVLINTLKEINNPEFKLLIIGNDNSDYAMSLKNMAKNLSSIQFLGKKSDVRPYLSVADVFVIPTLKLGEGLPVAPIEAMASGIIVIGSNVSGVKDVLEPFPKCIFEPNNVESLKKCLLKINNMKTEEYCQLKKDMRSRAERKYALENSVELHVNFYQTMLS